MYSKLFNIKQKIEAAVCSIFIAMFTLIINLFLRYVSDASAIILQDIFVAIVTCAITICIV